MSAGSRKKHNNSHKTFNGGSSADHGEIERLLASETRSAADHTHVGDKQSDTTTAPQSDATEVYGVEVHGTEYKRRNIIAVVVRGVKESLFADGFNGTLKVLLEQYPDRITGLRTGFEAGNYSSTQKRIQAFPSEARFELAELEGRVVDDTLHKWADVYNDYATEQEGLAKKPANYGVKIKEEDVTIDVLFIEPDSSLKKVSAAWLGKNLFPSRYSGIDSNRELFAEVDRTRTIVTFDLAGKYSRSEQVNEQAQAVLDNLVVSSANPYSRLKIVTDLVNEGVESKA